ncbi:hypothetical protein NADFUDRAFT_83069 [Nadsonia fulvescens var. elongata DSM 6958]|uniref:ferric-chelate reductase (NADPH) n=1 Tax=Nadsonia fulvescens var. elongata DSM 6958 TaxID=857566 RepID=A0A1E3PHP0_9ASCO|nr:hypothetical protein NADFUDRAFT_83069 [Nadsonia fulvescens var. elongata DSM 6958]
MDALDGIDLSAYGIYRFKNAGVGSYDAGHVPRPGFLARIYWYIVGGFLAILTISNIISKLVGWNRRQLARQKNKEVQGNQTSPAYTSSRLAKSYFAVVSTMREIINYTVPSIMVNGKPLLSAYALGDIVVITSYLLLLTVLFLVKLGVNAPDNFETFGYRGAWLSIGQLPLLIILAGRRSILGFLIGKDAASLNRYHRWVARGLLLTTSLHFLYFMRHWASYNFIAYQFKSDKMTRTGTAAWSILVWIVISSFAPVRQWRYEVFVIQHLISVFAFFVMVCIHAPGYAYPAIMVSIGFYLFDRVVRFLFMAFYNRSLVTKGSPPQACVAVGSMSSLTPSVVVTIPTPAGLKWYPGQHIYLNFPKIAPTQSHPFTVLSSPQDGELKFHIRARGGLTQKLYSPLVDALPTSGAGFNSMSSQVAVLVDGPYGPIHSFDTFDTTVFLAAGTGMSFILPLVRDLVSKSRNGLITTQRVHVSWVFKQFSEIEAYYPILVNMLSQFDSPDDANNCSSLRQLKFLMDMYITCEDSTAIEGITTKARLMAKSKKKKARSKKAREADFPLNKGECGQLDGICCCSNEGSSTSPPCTCCCAFSGGSVEDKHESYDSKSGLFPSELRKVLSIDSKGSGTTCVNQSPVDKLTALIQSFPRRVALHTARPRSLRYELMMPHLVKARGEASVCVCGPRSFNEAVRRHTVAISDQRAVNRGTGAQAIYLYEEAYDF